jgi:hypothetical protein
MSDELVLFRTLFDSSPNLTILNINNNCNEITKELQSIVDDSFGNLIIKQSHEIQPKNFRLQDRNFEYAIISDYLHLVENQDRFITSIYHSLENSAFIIILQKKENMDINSMKELLDKNNFRAVNDINIFEKYHLVMGKKLHMWGAGQ